MWCVVATVPLSVSFEGFRDILVSLLVVDVQVEKCLFCVSNFFFKRLSQPVRVLEAHVSCVFDVTVRSCSFGQSSRRFHSASGV